MPPPIGRNHTVVQPALQTMGRLTGVAGVRPGGLDRSDDGKLDLIMGGALRMDRDGAVESPADFGVQWSQPMVTAMKA